MRVVWCLFRVAYFVLFIVVLPRPLLCLEVLCLLYALCYCGVFVVFVGVTFCCGVCVLFLFVVDVLCVFCCGV